MKTKVLLLALLSGFVFSVAAQEYQPQGSSMRLVIRLISRRIKLATIGFISIAGWSQRIVRDQNGGLISELFKRSTLSLVSGLIRI